MKRVGEWLIERLEARGVDVVFGIPGIHTIELYRGLAASAIRHVTPRHEQGAAFMADGYARVSGRPGVCLLISGPGLTNAITAMAQARADRIPMLVISGVNARETLGKGRGHLHELPDQSALMGAVALATRTLREPAQLDTMLSELFAIMLGQRPGPVHLEIPLDVMAMGVDGSVPTDGEGTSGAGEESLVDTPAAAAIRMDRFYATASDNTEHDGILRIVSECARARRIVMLVGGGASAAGMTLQDCADHLDAPVVSTVNARGLLAGHPLVVPASPSLKAVRALIADADLVIAIGTEMGPTDYDMFECGAMPAPLRWVRVDSDPKRLAAEPRADIAVRGDACAVLARLLERLLEESPVSNTDGEGARRAQQTRAAAREEIGCVYRDHVALIDALWHVVPDATIVGDSTQLVYAGNLYVEAPRPRAWFNSSTGYGTLGYAPPAAIGAWLADPDKPVICLVGDGGLQFSLAEMGSARDVDADVAFIVWNNHGYREIETAMRAASIAPIGVTPSAPDFVAIAQAYGLPATQVAEIDSLLESLRVLPRPCLIEWLDR